MKHGDVPDSLILPKRSIELLTDRHRPQEKGGFADIYIGRWLNQLVGIKTFRISGSEAIETTMKVRGMKCMRNSVLTVA